MSYRALLTGAIVALVGVSALACDGRRAPGRVPPAAEFLFAAGDSTYWVRSGADGMRVRSAPILLTQADGKFYEVFISEDGVEYEDASFGSSRIWSRELTQKDSLSLFSDSTVLREASSWKKRHPTAAPIDPDDEEAPEDPLTIVREEIEIVDVHGPWLTFRQLLDIDVDGGETHRHVGRRAVVDVRTGQLATLAALVGEAEATRVTAAARASLAQLLDSVRNVSDDRAELAREALDSFRFDSTSFGLTDSSRAPAVAFLVPGASADGEALAIYLPPISIAAPNWWTAVRATLPEWAKDSSRVQWTRGDYDVAARPSSDGESLALMLSGRSALGSRDWPIATVAAPAYQLIALDKPPVSATVRDALGRAFDASATLDGVAQRARYRAPSRRRSIAPSVRLRQAVFRSTH